MIPSLDIVIVNWNSGCGLADCLAALTQADRPASVLKNIIVVDNASHDDSLNGCEEIRLPITVIRNSENRGFARACNQGAALGESDYLLFLNPDVTLCDGSLSNAVAFLHEERVTSIGICGIRLFDEDGKDTTCWSRLPRPLTMLCKVVGLDKLRQLSPSGVTGRKEISERREVEQVIGACFFVRRALYDALHGFDERFFMYYEEVDLSFRARGLGFRSYYLGDLTGVHTGGGCSKHVKGRRLFYVLRSRLAFAKKHFSRPAYIGIAAATLTIEPFARLLRAGIRLSGTEARNTLEAYVALCHSIRKGRPGLHAAPKRLSL